MALAPTLEAMSLEHAIDASAIGTGFSGVVSIARGETVEFTRAYGYAHRGYRVPNTIDTRFGLASGAKGFTALAVVHLVATGLLPLDTTARSVLGSDLPLVDDAVTIEHLLAHRSGIGDYLDEDGPGAVTDYAMRVPVHELATTEQYLAVLAGYPSAFAPGERFAYCNGGFVILALIAERVSGTPFHDLVQECVCTQAATTRTEFLRSDELPGDAATGYLGTDTDRTNVLHLPVRGSGDGGIYSTVADLSRFWTTLFEGRIVATEWVREMVRPRSDVPRESMRYGLGFWLHASSDVVILEGMDAGVSFRSMHDPITGLTRTVISNTTDGAWPIARVLADQLVT